MVLGRKRFGTVVVAVGIVLLLVAGGLAVPVGAQGQECPGAREVQTIEDTGITQGAPFTIEGDLFRITSDVTATTEGNDLLAFQIFVQDENGDLVTIATQEEEGTQSTFVNDSPGEFSLNINGANATYTVVVEDCTGAGNGGGNGGDDGSTNDQYTDQDDDNNDDDDVINVPDKPLPNTGGFPPLLAAGFFLVAGAGLLTALLRRRF